MFNSSSFDESISHQPGLSRATFLKVDLEIWVGEFFFFFTAGLHIECQLSFFTRLGLVNGEAIYMEVE